MSTLDKSESSIGRRRFMQGLGATAAAGVGFTYTEGPVQDAEAIPPVLFGAGLLAGAAAPIVADWALREVGYLDADAPPDGLTQSALYQTVYESARARLSNNRSTFIDNQTLADGIKNTAYVDGKVDGIDALNEGLPEADVDAMARGAVTDYDKVVVANFIRSWNETVQELWHHWQKADDHPDVSVDGMMVIDHGTGDGTTPESVRMEEPTERQYEFADGTVEPVKRVTISWRNHNDARFDDVRWDPFQDDSEGRDDYSNTVQFEPRITYNIPEKPDVVVADYDGGWGEMGDALEATFDDVRSGISLWVSSVYGDVQSGEISLGDLLTPRERAAMMADGEETPNALADLIALNIPVDLEREATIRLINDDVILRGTLGLSQEQPITAGETYDPSTMDGTVYLTYDISTGEGEWSFYEVGVDGGIVSFTEEPHEETLYRVETTAGETAEALASDFAFDDETGNYTVDLSEQMETPITEIDSVRYYADSDEVQYETVQLQSEFDVVSLVDSDGEEVQTAEFSSSEPQDDQNYITQEEWDQMQEENERLIQQYEDSLDDGSGGGITLPGFGDVEGLGAIAGGVAVVGGVVLVLKQVADFYLPG